MTIHGKLEHYYGGVVTGWAANSEALARTVSVALLVDGEKVAEAEPSIERRDVERLGLPLVSGLRMSVPEASLDGGVHEIALVLDGVVIPGGPRRVTLTAPSAFPLQEAPLPRGRIVFPRERVRLHVDRLFGDPAQRHHFVPEALCAEADPHYETDDTCVYELDDCRVLFPDGIILSGDHILHRTLYLVDRDRYAHVLRRDGTLLVDEEAIETVEEPTFLFNAGSQHNYFHWHMDVLPKCLVLDAVHQPGMRVALPVPEHRFQSETIARITERFPHAAPVMPRGVKLVRFRKLFYTPGLSGKALRPASAIGRFFEDDEARDAASVNVADLPRRIFLSRRSSRRRRLIGEESLARALRERGFVVVDPEELDTAAQRALFRRAELVVGPHGAAFTNLLHANPQVGVVELFADRYVNVGPQRIANLKALAYGYVIGATRDVDGRLVARDASFEVDVDEVLARLDDVARCSGHALRSPASVTAPVPSPVAAGPRVVIHVGPGKTGSSALQQWLTTHRDDLEASGVLYPAHDLDRNGVSSGNREALLDMVEVDGKHRHHVSAAKAAALRDGLRASRCHTLLLSSEFFYPLLTDIERELPEAEFVVYVRDPVELLESNYNQSVKRHDETKAFVAPAAFRPGIFVQLERLLKADRAPRLVVRPYGDGLFTGGDIVGDLLSVLRAPRDAAALPRRVNASYTLDALEFKRHANHFELGPLQPVIDRTLQAYGVGQRDYSLVPPEQFRAMREACVTQLDRLLATRELEELRPLREQLVHRPQRTFVHQAVSRAQLFAVADHLEANEPETFEHLRARVRRAPGRDVPNPEFYARFR